MLHALYSLLSRWLVRSLSKTVVAVSFFLPLLLYHFRYSLCFFSVGVFLKSTQKLITELFDHLLLNFDLLFFLLFVITKFHARYMQMERKNGALTFERKSTPKLKQKMARKSKIISMKIKTHSALVVRFFSGSICIKFPQMLFLQLLLFATEFAYLFDFFPFERMWSPRIFVWIFVSVGKN